MMLFSSAVRLVLSASSWTWRWTCCAALLLARFSQVSLQVPCKDIYILWIFILLNSTNVNIFKKKCSDFVHYWLVSHYLWHNYDEGRLKRPVETHKILPSNHKLVKYTKASCFSSDCWLNLAWHRFMVHFWLKVSMGADKTATGCKWIDRQPIRAVHPVFPLTLQVRQRHLGFERNFRWAKNPHYWNQY